MERFLQCCSVAELKVYSSLFDVLKTLQLSYLAFGVNRDGLLYNFTESSKIGSSNAVLTLPLRYQRGHVVRAAATWEAEPLATALLGLQCEF